MELRKLTNLSVANDKKSEFEAKTFLESAKASHPPFTLKNFTSTNSLSCIIYIQDHY